MKTYTVKRQQNSKNWGVFCNSVLIEGGFFSKDAAENCAQSYRDEQKQLQRFHNHNRISNPDGV